jgi:hypothetical protein
MNKLLKKLKIKAKDLDKIAIENLIFSLNNVETHYITYCDYDTFYCYKCYSRKPENDTEIKEYCKEENLHRSLHDNDYERRIELTYATIEAYDELLKYLTKKDIVIENNQRIKENG